LAVEMIRIHRTRAPVWRAGCVRPSGGVWPRTDSPLPSEAAMPAGGRPTPWDPAQTATPQTLPAPGCDKPVLTGSAVFGFDPVCTFRLCLRSMEKRSAHGQLLAASNWRGLENFLNISMDLTDQIIVILS